MIFEYFRFWKWSQTGVTIPRFFQDSFMNIETLLQAIKDQPDAVAFSDVIAVIESSYQFTESAFRNGETYNEAGSNNGSCKIFAFAKLNGLSVSETLACFGDYYRKDVLQNPDGQDHQNIRNFMVTGWEGVEFEAEALTAN